MLVLVMFLENYRKLNLSYFTTYFLHIDFEENWLENQQFTAWINMYFGIMETISQLIKLSTVVNILSVKYKLYVTQIRYVLNFLFIVMYYT